MNDKFIVDMVYLEFVKAGIPTVRLDPFNIVIEKANFVFYVAPKQCAFQNPFNSVCFSPVLFNDFKLLLLVDKKVKIPEKILKITDKIMFFDSPDEFLEKVKLMAEYAKQIHSRIS